MVDRDKKWWFNHRTGEVEFGRKSLSMDRDGPYESEEEARRAPEIARQRSEQWDRDERFDDNA